MRFWRILLLLLFLATPTLQAAEFDHAPWHALLQKHVSMLNGGQASQVNYQGMLNDRADLKAYLSSLSAVDKNTFNAWPKNARLAFLINAYNAYTVELVLTRYPNLKSIKDIGSLIQSPWKKRFIPLLGGSYSLDDIEHGMIRKLGSYNEPRIHFAVNCASVGCPALRNEAYHGDTLDAQLETATRSFLADRTRNRFDAPTNTLHVSKIFEWYKKDFEQGWRGWNNLHAFFSQYAPVLNDAADAKNTIASRQANIVYLDYDWALNKQ